MTLNVPPEEEQLSLAAQLVRSLLERHGIAKHRHASLVGDLFGLSRAAAHQRVNRSAAWTLEELQHLAEKYGESLTDLVGAHKVQEAKVATLRVGGVQVACRIWTEEGKPQVGSDLFVAVQTGNAYTVLPATAADLRKSLRIARMDLQTRQEITGVPKRIAVLDDEDDVVSSLCEQLRGAGMEAVGFTSVKDLRSAIKKAKFDGYVIDWVLGDQNALPVLAEIRGQANPSAVVVLSGQMRNGFADPTDVASASTMYRVQVLEKPTHVPLIISTLENDGLYANA